MTPTTAPGPWEVQPPTLLEKLVRLGAPYLDATAANEEIIRLTLEVIRLEARLDELSPPLDPLCPWCVGPQEGKPVVSSKICTRHAKEMGA